MTLHNGIKAIIRHPPLPHPIEFSLANGEVNRIDTTIEELVQKDNSLKVFGEGRNWFS